MTPIEIGVTRSKVKVTVTISVKINALFWGHMSSTTELLLFLICHVFDEKTSSPKNTIHTLCMKGVLNLCLSFNQPEQS
jgi:hypothetical protein